MQHLPEAPLSSAGFKLLISRVDQIIKTMELLESQFTDSSPSDAAKIRRNV